MKAKKIALVSKWFNRRLVLRVPADVAETLAGEDGLEALNLALDSYYYGMPSYLLSEYQCKRVTDFFAGGDINYFASIELI